MFLWWKSHLVTIKDHLKAWAHLMLFPLIELQQGNIEIDRIANTERKEGERGEIEFRTDKSINNKCWVEYNRIIFCLIACLKLKRNMLNKNNKKKNSCLNPLQHVKKNVCMYDTLHTHYILQSKREHLANCSMYNSEITNLGA